MQATVLTAWATCGFGVRAAIWMAVVMLWVAAFVVARHSGYMSLAALVVVANFELMRRTGGENPFLEYVNAAYFGILLLVAAMWGVHSGFGVGYMTSEIALILAALTIIWTNRRFELASLRVLGQLLLLAAAIGALFYVSQDFFVPRTGLHRADLALEFYYYYWAKPIEMALVAVPFLFIALNADIKAFRTGTEAPRIVDVYYSYAQPILAFGLFPGVGRSLQGNCELASTYVAISAIAGLVLGGLALSLVFNRRSILMGAAASSLLLSANRCLELPVELIAFAVTAAMLVAWRWLPKGRNRPDAGVPA